MQPPSSIVAWLVRWLLASSNCIALFAHFVSSVCTRVRPCGTSPWCSDKCVRYGAGRSRVRLSAGSYQDLVNWCCSLPTRCTACRRAAGISPRTHKRTSELKTESVQTQLWRYKTIVVISANNKPPYQTKQTKDRVELPTRRLLCLLSCVADVTT